MPSCYRMCMAVALAFIAGWTNIAAAVVPRQAEGDLAMVTALKVQPADAQKAKVVLEGTARFDYTVLRPESRLITVDLYGVDTSKLQPSNPGGGRLIESIQVKSVGLPGKVAARVEIQLLQPCEVKSQFEQATHTLILELQIQGTMTSDMTSVSPALDAKKAVATANGTTIQSIETATNKDQFEAQIKTDGRVTFKHFLLHQPERLVIDLQDVQSAMSQRVVSIKDDRVDRVRIGSPSPGNTRIVFDLSQENEYSVVETAAGLVVKVGGFIAKNATQPVVKPAVASDTTRSRKAVDEPKETTPIVASNSKLIEEKVNPTSTLADLKPAAFTKVTPVEPVPVTSAKSVRDKKAQTGQFGEPGFVGQPVSIDITNVDLSDILRFLSDNYDVNFVLDKSATGDIKVTLKVTDVPWNQVLEAILRSNRLGYQTEGKLIRIATLTAFAEEEKQRTDRAEAARNNIPMITEYFKLKYERVLGGQLGGGGGAAAAAGGGGGGAGGTGPGSIGGVGLRPIVSQTLSQRGSISVNPRTNMLIVTDIPERVEKIRQIIARLDVAEPQVEIEARIVQADRTFLRDLGVQLFTGVVSRRGGGVGFSTSGGQAYGFGFGGSTNGGNGIIQGTFTPRSFFGQSGFASADSLFIGPLASGAIGNLNPASSVLSLTTGLIGTGFISAALTAAESKGIAKQISSPRVTVQNNSEGEIISGTSIPYTAAQAIGATAIATTTFQEATLGLKITPQITVEGNVLLSIESTNDSIDRSVAVNGQPGINRQSTKTLVLVPDGGTTIIGGVNVDRESDSVNRTPGISSIPLLGNLFKQRSVQRRTSELLFFITPRIFRGENFITNGVPPTPVPAPSPAGVDQSSVGGQP